MTIYSLYIFDRHCACIYYQDWHRVERPKPAVEGNLLPAVAKAVSPRQVTIQNEPDVSSPRNTLASSSGIVIAVADSGESTAVPPLLAKTEPVAPMSNLSFDEEAKLVYGVVLSLRNMVKKLAGRDEAFVNFKTSAYRFHHFETLTGYKFVMLSDPQTGSLSGVLRNLYTGPFLEYVVRNPLVTMDSKERGVDNEHFRRATDRLVRSLNVFP